MPVGSLGVRDVQLAGSLQRKTHCSPTQGAGDGRPPLPAPARPRPASARNLSDMDEELEDDAGVVGRAEMEAANAIKQYTDPLNVGLL